MDEEEVHRIVDITAEVVDGRVPVYVGCSGNDTAKVVKHAKALEARGAKGILSACPYYNRPDQRGIYEHFLRIAESTSLQIILYNIPYRTARNIENDTVRRLAEIHSIIGLKDSSGDIKQTSELLLDPPKDFSILTGEDALFYTALALGAGGGILASAHIATEHFLEVYRLMSKNDHQQALGVWKRLAPILPLLFVEPNPAPIKHLLRKAGLIASPQTRLPLVEITRALAAKLDAAIAGLA